MENKGFTEAGKDTKKEVQRGTQDELEVLALILLQLPIQKQLVLDRLRSARDRMAKQGKVSLAPTENKDAKKKKGP